MEALTPLGLVGGAKDFPDLIYCGTPDPTEEQFRQNLEIRSAPFAPDEKIIIDTYFHLVYSKDNFAGDFDKWFGNQVRISLPSLAF